MEADPTAGWFDGRELKLSAAGDDKSEMFVDPAACVYPDAFLRLLAGGRDDCGLLKPGADEFGNSHPAVSGADRLGFW